jgi:Protein of unknown function (DUF998)
VACLNRLALITGVLGAAWVLALTLIGGATFPGYDHGGQFISELGATGAPHGWKVRWLGFLPAGVLICAFAVFARLTAPHSVLSTLGFLGIFLFAIGYVGAAFFPCDFGCRPEDPSVSQMVHELVGLAGYLLAPLTLLLLGLAARKWPGGGWLAILGYVTAIAALGCLVMLDPNFALVGVAQRVLEASVLGWIVACAIYLGGQSKTAAR